MGLRSIIEMPIIHKPHRERKWRLKQFSNVLGYHLRTMYVEDTTQLFKILEKSRSEISLSRISPLLRRSLSHMRELAVQPKHIFLPLFRLFYLQSSPSIAIKLEISISEHKTDEYVSLLSRDRTDHSLSIPDFPADCLLGSHSFVKKGWDAVHKRFPAYSQVFNLNYSRLLHCGFLTDVTSQLFNLQS